VNRGNSGIHQPEPKERAFGETRRLEPKAKPEGVGVRGNPQPYREAQLEERGIGETQAASARSAEGRETRGNSGFRRRHSRKMQGSVSIGVVDVGLPVCVRAE